MDCQMPQMDGFEATRVIRRLEEHKRHIPIVALTADAMKEAEQNCREAGMDDFLSKPIERDKLSSCLARHLRCIETMNEDESARQGAEYSDAREGR
jgi:CheY-like chemotaxis protein